MIVLTNTQKVAVTIQPVDSLGNPALVEGVPVWSVSDPNLLTLDVAADGMSGFVVTVGPVGLAQVNVSADADLGEGVTTITGLLDVEVIASEAVTFNITTGIPEPR